MSASTPPREAEADAPSPSGAVTPRPRRSVRVQLRVRSLPSEASSSTLRSRRRSPKAPSTTSIVAKAEEWGKEKAAAGAPEEECVLPFLRKGAPRKVECLICSKSILPDERTQCSVIHCVVTLHKDAGPTDDIKEAFRRLPLPYIDQEFDIDPINKQDLKTESEPPPYKKSEGRPIKGGCINCDHGSTCGSSCSCRSSMTSCSLGCPCSVKCSNKPFRREKKIEIVKTRQCGWGAIALETIGKDDFVIEFVGEVIDDAMCEDRLQDMRQRRDQNFYMCKVDKDFVIDPTFKGNACRFFNHSCQPNCRLEKWQVNGKTRLGVFASQTIEVGMPLTYNYRFRTSFGPEKECFCGAPNCQGKL
ncbi:Histone-lysine N-methyltransferase ASHR3 [Zea mays]|uniref:Histone-lysine N-methyltransferase ASHR3 n=1 Tax=Zea mays TaxID=4577 RepID=A0A317YAK7_MAIZE|nr:Histone-lysine N-methyltransferase ASHR3 [Zea mays]